MTGAFEGSNIQRKKLNMLTATQLH